MIDLAFARRHLSTNLDDTALQEVLDAAEAAVKAYCNNAFPERRYPDGLPLDVQMGIVKMAAWQIGAGKKIGIASETLSRHSVTYAQNADDSVMGYPRSIMGFCAPYRRCHS